ncbi:MAG: hypothetical protein OMM_03667 [Candidatus Magnetoglobus multicellularis str. Araruama]|uniref:Schlafen AlbA-2 domain-containing protein n=1 Tax=Candidatus Magnetoglobus multicellularis str. Araruama TaxID=890399 RepID=A0A1V1P4T2_9BACT|nr:MAG: hypothetical protein OMM_03667 [Candidatus Magnetoglobus multicellularis str. Araruama]
MFATTDDLLNQIRLGEDSFLELKALEFKSGKISGPDRKQMADELAAMANTSGGVLVLGVDDRTKSLIGIPLENLDLVETWIRNICNDLITPQLLCQIRKLPISMASNEERFIVRIDIHKSLHVHKSPGGYFHRIGSSKRQMTTDILSRLFQSRSQTGLIRFDEQAVRHAPKSCLKKKYWEVFKTPLSSDDNDDVFYASSVC